MSYPQGYLYQPPGSLALYSCPAYGASALAAPRSEELGRSSSGSAFSPYPGAAAFSSALQYTADPTAGFPSYMVRTTSSVVLLCVCEFKILVLNPRCHSLGTPPLRLGTAAGRRG